MSTLDLEDRYRLMKCVAVAGDIRSHHAQERTTGKIVMVHIMDEAEPDALQYLKDVVDALPPAHKTRVLEIIPLTDRSLAVVTDFLQGFSSFRDWLARRVPGAYAKARASQIMPAVSATDLEAEPISPASATVVRRTGAFAPDDTPVGAPIAPPVPASAPAAQPPAPPAGDFTRMFGAGGTPVSTPEIPPLARESPPSPPAPPVEPPTPSRGAPGEFTQLFTAKPAPPDLVQPPPASAPVAPPRMAPGEFTQMFSAPQPPARVPEQPRVPVTPLAARFDPAPLPPPTPAFPAAAIPPAPVAPAPPPLSPVPPAPPAPVFAPPAPVFAPPSIPQKPVMPPPLAGGSPFLGGGAARPSPMGTPQPARESGGEYTRIIKSAVTPTPPTAAPPVAAVSPPKPKRGLPLGLIITLNVVLLLAVALILYFVLRPKAPALVAPATPATPAPAAAATPPVKTSP